MNEENLKKPVQGSYEEIYAKSQKAGTTENFVPDFVDMKEPGAVILGRLEKTEPMKGDNGSEYLLCQFETDHGRKRCTVGAYLRRELDNPIAWGKIYRIENLGREKTNTGNSMHKYSVLRIPE